MPKLGKWENFRGDSVIGQDATDTTSARAVAVDATYDALQVNLPSRIAGEDVTLDLLKIELRYSYRNITTATTTVVKSGAGFLHQIVIGKAVATGTIAIYDNTSGAAPLIGTITFGAALLSDPPLTAEFNVSFGTGLTIVTSQATDITVSYR